jgi:hypothetical protein
VSNEGVRYRFANRNGYLTRVAKQKPEIHIVADIDGSDTLRISAYEAVWTHREYQWLASVEINDLAWKPADGRASLRKWTPMEMRRKSWVRKLDCYYGPKNLEYSSGIFSSRAIELLQPYMTTCFSVLACSVNRKPHYFLLPKKRESCLDIENSQIQRFDDGRIMDIKRYRFKKGLVPDPLVFAIREAQFLVFTTVSIPSIVANAGLTGIAFYPVDGNGREYTWRG